MEKNINILLVGAGYMGREYAKVFKKMGLSFTAITRTQKTADKYEEDTGAKAIVDNLKHFLDNNTEKFTHAVSAVGDLYHIETSEILIRYGIKNILVEKPLSVYLEPLLKFDEFVKENHANIYIAYNRRFYSSTRKALEIIKEDGGLQNVAFEFTEWKNKIDFSIFPKEVQNEWLIANSSHVIDLAFYFAGKPIDYRFYSSRKNNKDSDIYVGAGVTDKNIFFSYEANWDGPGRWAVELITGKHRLYLKPMEKLAIQNLNSVAVEEYKIDDEQIDIDFKPGIYKEVEAFLFGHNRNSLKTIAEQIESLKIYNEITNGSK